MPTDLIRTDFNLFVLRNLNKARSNNDIIAINYWKGMFV